MSDGPQFLRIDPRGWGCIWIVILAILSWVTLFSLVWLIAQFVPFPR